MKFVQKNYLYFNEHQLFQDDKNKIIISDGFTAYYDDAQFKLIKI